jgi:ubiquinol-cytochrome c reductase cytochrome c1 subunit
MTKRIALSLSLLFAPLLLAAAEPAAEPAAEAVNWHDLHAGNEVGNISSLQRGARNFTNYCLGCHSLQYLRWSRLGTDLRIPVALLKTNLIPPGAKPADYIKTTLRAEDAVAWLGKEPPDLSLIARSRGVDYLYRFLKTFYVDPARPSRSNNLALENPAMPAVLSELEGVKAAVFKNVDVLVDGKSTTQKVFDHFTQISPGQLNAAQYDDFVRDTVNFLDYAGEPAQVDRRNMGVWVVLFLLVFTGIAWFMKKEYWKDVH